MRASAFDGSLAAARKRFFDGGTLPEGLVSAPILRSWQRCAEQGLQTGQTIHAEPLTQPELREKQQRNDFLRQISRPEIATLRAEAKQTDSVVIITDAEGLVLDTVGSVEFADQASRVALRPGVMWNEGSTGTNAIGTALFEKRAIQVLGAEHFFDPHQMLSCAAAPILDPRGRLAGVLDMSGHASVQHLHALGLVKLAVEQIEHRFFNRGFEAATVVRFHRDAGLLGTAREAVLVFEDGKLVAGNRRAMRLFGLDRSAFDRVEMEELFANLTLSPDRQMVLDHKGERFMAEASGPAVTARRPTMSAVPLLPQAEPYLTPKARESLGRAVKLCNAEIPLLIEGETGTGKEVFARRLHALSNRRHKPFVAINCAALPEALIESELFGYEEGAFTGAKRHGHKGLVQQAQGGILFLDEIGDMPLALQSRMLRILQDKQVTPLGGGKAAPVDFVPVCATHQPLKQMVDEGRFRADLYFRIAQYTITLEPLREIGGRGAAIAALWQQIEPDMPLSEAALAMLSAYSWPGNFRQLSSTLRAARALAEPGESLGIDAFPAEIAANSGKPSGSLEMGLDALTENAMREALEASDGNVSKAARRLGVDRSTLYRRVLWKGTAH